MAGRGMIGKASCILRRLARALTGLIGPTFGNLGSCQGPGHLGGDLESKAKYWTGLG